MPALRPPPPLVAAAAILACAAACGPPAAVRYDDLVAEVGRDSAAAAAEDGQLERRQAACADRTLYSLLLRRGDEATLEVELGEEPTLRLSACREERRGRLVATIESDGEPPRTVRLWVDGSGWEELAAPLPGLAGRRVTLRIAAAGPPGPPLVVAEASLRHRPRPAAERRRGRGGPPILLVSIDALRADLGGAAAADVPALARLAAEAESYAAHYASATWTKPSHASLLTGERPAVHGVIHGASSLDPAVATVAERLRAEGYATGGLVHDCTWLDPRWGFGRGFDSYRSLPWGAGPLGRSALDWMAAHRERPFFFFLHVFDAHSDFHRLPYEGPGVTRRTVEERFGLAGYGCRQGNCATDLLVALDDGRVPPAPDEAEVLRFLYAAGLRDVDGMLALLRRDLEELGLWDDLLVVVTSDHGELLLEHGRTLHGHPWEEVARVPLWIKWPGGERAGRRVEVPTSGLDVTPTLLAAAGVDPGGLGAGGLPGADLRRPPPRRRPLHVDDFSFQAIRLGEWKALFRPEGPDRLFDLAADPGEERDLAAARQGELERLRALLAAADGRDARRLARLREAAARQGEEEAAAPGLSEEEKARLRSLGYLRGDD